jgi:hypothetical protein
LSKRLYAAHASQGYTYFAGETCDYANNVENDFSLHGKDTSTKEWQVSISPINAVIPHLTYPSLFFPDSNVNE